MNNPTKYRKCAITVLSCCAVAIAANGCNHDLSITKTNTLVVNAQVGNTRLAFAPDSMSLAVASCGWMTTWRVPDLECNNNSEKTVGEIYSLCYSPDGRLLCTVGYQHGIRIWNS